MTKEHYTTEFKSPSAAEFNILRKAIGWEPLEPEVVQESLANSLFHVVIRDQECLIAVARIVGDGAMYFYVQDVIVHPITKPKVLEQSL